MRKAETVQTILVLFGGCSTEHEVSLQSAAAVLEHIDPARFRALPVGITREGRWLRYLGPAQALPGGKWQQAGPCVPCTLTLDRGGCRLLWLDGSGQKEAFDAAFPVLHGKNGEDGTIQGLFELAGVPVVGCGVLPSALAMDKDRAHKLAALAGVAVPEKRGVCPRRGCGGHPCRRRTAGLAAVCQTGAGGVLLRHQPGGRPGRPGRRRAGGLLPRRRDPFGGGRARL